MELRKGYKDTEIGVIPEDWAIRNFGEITEKIIGGGTPSRSNQLYWGNEIPWVTVKDFATFNPYQTQEYITKEGLKNSASHLIPKGIIITSTRMALGKAVIYNVDVSINQDLKAIFPVKYLDTKFFYYWFQFNSKCIEDLGSGSTVMGLSLPDLRKIKIKLPTKTEQIAIATALSDADALINSLEKLIAKKRNIKQGAMQKLLQPKEGWEERSILQIADYKKELFDDGDWIESEHITDKGIRLIQTGNIGIGTYVEKENRKYIFKESFEKLGCKTLRVGDLLICRLAEPAGRACIFPIIGDEKVITSVDVTIFRPREEVANRQFLNQIFSTNNWFKSISDKCGGTTHKRISRGTLGKIKILLPEIGDQTHIATILSDMDNEITTLETKLEKYRKVKLGMMQNLLTGKIRLV